MTRLITLLLSALLLVLACNGVAAIDSRQESIDVTAEKLAAIQSLLATTGAAANSQQFERAFSQQLISVLKITNPALSDEAITIVNEEVKNIVSAEFADDSLQKEIYPLYARHFSLSELQALLRFNKSEVGIKANQIMPLLMQESLNAAQAWSLKIGPKISAQVLKRFEEKGIPIRAKITPVE